MQRRYAPHPGLLMEERARAKLLAETGKSFEQWVALAKKQSALSEPALRAWLRTEHGLSSRVGWWIASAARAEQEPGYDEPEKLVDSLYSGKKAVWRELHEKLVDEMLKLGKDVLVTSCKTMVPVYRKFVFAELRPMAQGVQLRLATGKGSGNDRLDTKRLVRDAKGIDAELRAALRAAYEQGAVQTERALEHELPPELATALKKSKTVAATWEQCTPAMRRDLLEFVSSAKQAATRAKRLAAVIAKLEVGERRVY
ncbi:MAG: YdeI/OmpD-associated family protein [Planctomycetes bacterium]|nr:YdeI/OmpD-associated family protein [Planctomycetota bacterium]